MTVCPSIVNTGLCKKPRIRFETLLKVIEPGDAADTIIDAMRRDQTEITIPQDLHYVNRVKLFMCLLIKFKIKGTKAEIL